MATARPFAYNTGSTIDGTIQYGDLAVGTPTTGFTGSMEWWNGADEDLGYVIAGSVPSDTQPAPDGRTASVQFWRSKDFTEASFIELANSITKLTFTSGNEASIYLESNGYWDSWNLPTPTPTPTPTITPTMTLTPTNTLTPTPTPTNPCPLNLISDSNLNAYYKFDNNVLDSSGNDLTLTNVSSTFQTGKVGSALDLNGTSSRVFRDNNSLYGGLNNTISVVFWFNIFGYLPASVNSLTSFYGNNMGWKIDFRPSFRIDETDFVFTINSTEFRFTVSGVPGGWRHLAFTYNNTLNSVKLYFDGVEYARNNTELLITNQTTSQFEIGGGQYRFRGLIDEYAVWGRALSSGEISTLYNTTCPIKR